MPSGVVYLYKKCVSSPISAVWVDIPDGKSDDQKVLIAAHALMKDFKVELMLEEEDEPDRGRLEEDTGEGACQS